MSTMVYKKYKDTKSGIYFIRNIKNGKFLIGSTDCDKRRWYAHRNSLRNNKHPNSHLQRAWNKWGESAFEFQLIVEVEPKNLFKVETAFLDKYWGLEWCYNLNKSADRPALGRKWTDEQRIRASEKAKGRKLSPEEKEKLLKPPLNADARREIKRQNIKKAHEVNKGFIFDESRRKNISISKIGIVHSNETKNKIRAATKIANCKKYKFSEEQKNTMRQMFDSGQYTQKYLAEMFQCSPSHFGRIVRNIPRSKRS